MTLPRFALCVAVIYVAGFLHGCVPDSFPLARRVFSCAAIGLIMGAFGVFPLLSAVDLKARR